MSYIDMSVKCPFYVKSSGVEIMCEGANDNMRCHNTFINPSEQKRKEERAEYMRKFCCTDDYVKCPLAIGLEQKYE